MSHAAVCACLVMEIEVYDMGTFEFDGEKYKQASRHQTEWGHCLIEELSLEGNETILDLGCGDGGLTEQLALLVPDGQVLGIDASEGMIAAAQNRSQANLSFERMDINTIHFQNMFDVIFSNAALHWILDHKRLLRNAYEALKENGALLWDFAGDGNCACFFEVVRETIQSEIYSPYFSDFQWPWYMPAKEEYEQMMSAVGFTQYIVSEVNRDRFFSNADEMIRWIDQPSIVPFISVLPDEMKAQFREDIINLMLKRTLQADGTCFETFRRIHVKAEK